jgi:hypothetical protein
VVRPFSRFNSSEASALIIVLLLFCAPLLAQKGPQGKKSTTVTRIYSVRGKVVDSQDHTQLENVRVELRSFSGETMGAVATHTGGEFEFHQVSAGIYDLVVLQAGYHTVNLRLGVDESVFGLTVELHRTLADITSTHGASSVSARELSIPRNAHEAMDKGLKLMNEKSDYPGSIKQFERAIKEFPEYYEAYTEIGIAYLHAGNSAGAEGALRKAVALSQEHYLEALSWLATLLNDARHFADAEPFAQKGVQLDSSSMAGEYGIGTVIAWSASSCRS